MAHDIRKRSRSERSYDTLPPLKENPDSPPAGDMREEKRRAALHSLQRYDEAMDGFTLIFFQVHRDVCRISHPSLPVYHHPASPTVDSTSRVSSSRSKSSMYMALEETSDRLSLSEPRKLIVQTWVRNLRDPPDGFTRGSTEDDDGDSDLETATGIVPTWTSDTGSARFHVLLLQQQPDGEFKRVAAEHKILGPGLDQQINISRVIRISRYSTPNYPVFKV
ncbi:hypothetical protein V8E55_007557 [Tylopilus felleus]